MLPFGTRFRLRARKQDRLLCVIGLGNPGREYSNHRHNIGFRVVDRYAERLGIPSMQRNSLFHYGSTAIGGKELALCKPRTYMNRSGRAAEYLVRKSGWEPQRFLIVYDDVSIPLGSLRVRSKGSSGGHNGLQSIVDALGTTDVPRMRFGVGPAPDGADLAEFVLSDFSDSAREAVERTIERACDAITFSIANGMERTMNVFNSTTITTQE